MCIRCFQDAVRDIEADAERRHERIEEPLLSSLEMLKGFATGTQADFIRKLRTLSLVLIANPSAAQQFMAVYQDAARIFFAARQEALAQQQEPIIDAEVVSSEPVSPEEIAARQEFEKAMYDANHHGHVLSPGSKKAQ